MNLKTATKEQLERKLNRLIKNGNSQCNQAKYIKYQLKRRT